jgi:hypothetical protein
MAQDKSMDTLATIIEALKPLSSEERTRLVRAAMVFLGETPATKDLAGISEDSVNSEQFPPRAKAWMRQHSVTTDQLEEVFHLSDGTAEVMGSLPGRNKKEQTYSAYILTGLCKLLLTGSPSFDDKAARELCEKSGCYDSANHSAHLRDRGNEFSGSKEKGWTLTAPGLKRGAEIIKEIQTS